MNNPLCGPNGASVIFGPQKGATSEMVQQLDRNLRHFADLVETSLDISSKPSGAGAAGGLGFGLMAFAGAKLQSGVALIMEQNKLAQKLRM